MVVTDGGAPWKGVRVAEYFGSCNTDYKERQKQFPFSKFSCQQIGNSINLFFLIHLQNFLSDKS